MKNAYKKIIIFAILIVLTNGLEFINVFAQDSGAGLQILDENCVVSVLNRTSRVQSDGTWRINNLPSNMGRVRARASCVIDDKTLSAQSDFFTIPPNGIVQVFGEFEFEKLKPVVARLNVAAGKTVLTEIGEISQLSVIGTFSDSSIKDLTASNEGTNYLTSNPLICDVSSEGVVTATGSGNVLISVLNEGALTTVNIRVKLVANDDDEDGLPNDFEIVNGLDPNDPVDALEDIDMDKLNNLGEFGSGTDLRIADTDNDGLDDGEEVNETNTNPLLADSDGDLLLDPLEIAAGTNPDVFDDDLSTALSSIEVDPDTVVLSVSAIVPGADLVQQLSVTGNMIDGSVLDLTDHESTNYTSSDLTVVNFGIEPGQIFPGVSGSAVITVTNSGFSDSSSVTVQSFDPLALSVLNIPGFANNVDVAGDFAYVAAGAEGLQVVSIADRNNPSIIGNLDTPGNANDIKVVNKLAYIADGDSGLQIFDVSVPNLPIELGAVDTPGIAYDVRIAGNRAYIADGLKGLQIIDVNDPANPQIVGSIDTHGTAYGVDVTGGTAIVANIDSVLTIDISNEQTPQILGMVENLSALDLVANDNVVYVANSSGSRSGLVVVDIGDVTNPIKRKEIADNILVDIEFFGRFALGADIFRVNGVPVFDINDIQNPLFRSVVDFSPRLSQNSGKGFLDDNGTGIAADSNFVYLTAERGITLKGGRSGSTRLYIGQYLNIEDNRGVPPTIEIISPIDGETVFENDALNIEALASDDVFVAAVNFFIDGELKFVDSSPPYTFDFRVPKPLGVTAISIKAEAVDLGNNIGMSNEIILNVNPGFFFRGEN